MDGSEGTHNQSNTVAINLTPVEAKLFEVFGKTCKLIRKEHNDIPDLLGGIGEDAIRFVWVAGGFVRDKILKVDSKDIDIIIPAATSNIMLSTFKEICKKSGHDFIMIRPPKQMGQGVCQNLLLSRFTISINGEPLDLDMRECEKAGVPFNTDPKSRDFTVNAGYIDPLEQIAIDPNVGTFDDIKNKVLRTVVSPDKTFTPDPSRMIRAVRFHITKGFRLHTDVLTFINQKGKELMVGVETHTGC